MSSYSPANASPWQRRVKALQHLLIVTGVAAFGLVILFLALWHSFFVYVPPGVHLVVIAKSGADLPPGAVVAERGQKGVQREVLGEGWHFVMPFVYESKLEPNTVVPPGQVGVLTALGGQPLPTDRVLAEPEPDASGVERIVYAGIQRQVLMPGAYRINLNGYNVELAPMINVEPGFVGVRRRLRGKDGEGSRFARQNDEKGYLEEVLQPGLYALNPYEYQVILMEVGIYQTSFRQTNDPKQNTALKFTARNGFEISMECTIEWEILPQDQPALVLSYESRKKLEDQVIQPKAKDVGLAKGSEFGVQELLEGSQREKFQEEFRDGLIAACNEATGKDLGRVSIHSAFIRNIVIPEEYLKPIREKQVAAETVLTNQAKEETAKSTRDLEHEKLLVDQEVAKVKAETDRMVAGIEQQVKNVSTKTEAEVEKMKADYQSRIAVLEAEQVRLLGEATAKATEMKETAKAGLYKMKMDVFRNDADAFLRYTLAEKLNPNVSVRLVHSGPGTFWTNMDGKGLQFQIPALNGTQSKATPAPVPAK